jgi:HlyD family secretion protein
MAGQNLGKDKPEQQDESDNMAANDSKIKQKVEKAREIVFIVDNNAAKMVDVKRGISDDTYTEIINGLEEGKEVVSGSYKAINRELDAGSKVRIDNSKQKPGTKDSK